MTTDPIQLALFRNLLEAAAEEMGITLQRVAFSANIKERRDFTCALFSPNGALDWGCAARARAGGRWVGCL
jgi:N-methylhydantoinase B/oxoprolinase/acetone carboxylase alpha subunit